MNVLAERFKEVLLSVFPITAIVLILHFTLVPLEIPQLLRFLLGALLIIFGLSIFLFGVDIGITPIGNLMGSSLLKTNKIALVVIGGIILGFVASVAEPDIHILGGQVEAVTNGAISKVSIVVIVSLGIGLLLAVGFARIAYNISMKKTFTFIYLLIFILGLLVTPEFLAIAFDGAGAVTGALTVPFILALGIGMSSLQKDSKAAEEDSFGLVGITATGAVITVMIMGIISNPGEMTGSIESSLLQTDSIIAPFIQQVPIISMEVIIALLPIVILLLIFQKKSFKLSNKALGRILKGLLYSFIGLVLFLVGVNAGFMEVGTIVGHRLTLLDNKLIVVIIGFIVGLVTILAEPSAHVLTQQIEEVTSGYIKRKAVLATMCIGVGLAVGLFVLKILVREIQLWHYLFGGYFISLVLSYIVPPLFVGMAFDSGTVSSGPMTATFILAFAQGVADAAEGANVLTDGFGAVAMVTMVPVITVMVLGLIFKIKSRKEGIEQNG